MSQAGRTRYRVRPDAPVMQAMADESKNLSEESFEQHKELTHLEHISSVSTPDEELRRRFKNEIGSIRKKAEQALVEALAEISAQARRTIKKQAS